MNVITEDEIQEKLETHYGGYNNHRDLVKNERSDDHDGLGSIVYSLEGSPPKGYAIVIPDLQMVNLYDHQGKRFMILEDTVVHELEQKR